MTMNKTEAIRAVLQANGVDPDTPTETENGTRTAFTVMEAHVWAALEEIEEGKREEADQGDHHD